VSGADLIANNRGLYPVKNRLICLILFVFLPIFSVLADDTGVDVPPAVYAKQEAASSAVNFGQTLCNAPGYTCRSVTKKDTWYSLFPDFQQRQAAMRLNRTNVALLYRNWIVVPKDFSKMTYMDMSPLPAKMNTHGKNLLLVNLKLFAFGAYDENGNLLYWGPASSGASICPSGKGSCASPVGDFKVFRVEGKDCISHEYPLETHGGDPMPYCMYFHGGAALHASTLSGFINRSAGCIRLFNADAKWLYEKFVTRGTRVMVVN
jgi:L,D-transpeptidase ErfK/SrfK